jgi:hypothetical protein
MDQEKQGLSVIKAAGRIIRKLVSQPYQVPEETEDDEGGKIFAQPMPPELAIEHNRPVLYPASGYLQDSIRFLKGRTIWAVDGSILTRQFPNRLLLVGRAVVSRMSFSGYGSVQRVFDVPIVPFILYPPVEQDQTAPLNIEALSKDYLQHVFGKLPRPSPHDPSRSSTNYFADSGILGLFARIVLCWRSSKAHRSCAVHRSHS